MRRAKPQAAASLRLLIVEDEAMVAMLIEDILRTLDVAVVGPAGSVGRALQLIEQEAARLDGAMLDVNLGTEAVYPVAARLRQLAIPFAFLTGYGLAGLDPDYAGEPVLEKPFDLVEVEDLVARCFGADGADRRR